MNCCMTKRKPARRKIPGGSLRWCWLFLRLRLLDGIFMSMAGQLEINVRCEMQQENLIHYPSCPSCNFTEIAEALTARDHTVSQKIFSIWECSNCTLRFTQDVPDAASIGVYYQSENYISHT